jgi:hypothetical protein
MEELEELEDIKLYDEAFKMIEAKRKPKWCLTM